MRDSASIPYRQTARARQTQLRRGKLPLHQQLYDILRGRILAGQWKVGEMIPAEPELVEQFGVSRTTVRQVLERLVQEGLIVRRQGRGTFVKEPTLEQGLVRLVSFTEDMRQRGLTPGTQVLSQQLVTASQELAAKLNIAPGAELAHLRRLRLANGEPMSIEESYLIHEHCPGVLQEDYAANPLRETLEVKYGIQIVRARQVIRATAASKEQARLLGMAHRSPLLSIERISYSQYDDPVELLYIDYRADRYSLYNELRD